MKVGRPLSDCKTIYFLWYQPLKYQVVIIVFFARGLVWLVSLFSVPSSSTFSISKITGIRLEKILPFVISFKKTPTENCSRPTTNKYSSTIWKLLSLIWGRYHFSYKLKAGINRTWHENWSNLRAWSKLINVKIQKTFEFPTQLTWNLLVPYQLWKHQNNVWNLFSVKDEDSRKPSTMSF